MSPAQITDRETTESPGGVPLRSRGTRVSTLVKQAIGSVAALLGLVAILWVLLSPALGLTLVAFATGSMSPTIPQGALALAREVPASELEVGSVAMLQRSGERPVSHRILAIDEDPTSPDSRLVTMQGDDNPVPDPEPYRVTSGRVILASVPGGAAAFAFLRSPIAMGLLTAGAAALVLRAFWPTGSRDRGGDDDESGAADHVEPEEPREDQLSLLFPDSADTDTDTPPDTPPDTRTPDTRTLDERT